MSGEHQSFRGKLAAITAFLSAIAAVGALVQDKDRDDDTGYRPYQPEPLPPPQPVVTQAPQAPQLQFGQHCCDVFGIQRCTLVAPALMGSPCVCFLQGNGATCM
jgi:hypothetical protein